MADYIRACAVADIPEDRALAVTVAAHKVAIVRCEEGIFAVQDACSHADVALSEGEVSGCTLECWLHGSQFDVRTGRPLSPPATAPVPVFRTRIRSIDGEDIVEIDPDPQINNQRDEEAR